ncbi:MAG: adenosine-specific kinase [Nitrososphaeraceae archaeon]
METKSYKIILPPDTQIILAQSHFIKTVEDVHECVVNCVPNIKFGIGFCEASGPCLVRHSGNDRELESLATQYASEIGSGPLLVLVLENAYPINVLPRLKDVPEIAHIYCATANPLEVLIMETEQGRGVLGVVDGFKPKGVEKEQDILERKHFLRSIGYKLQ